MKALPTFLRYTLLSCVLLLFVASAQAQQRPGKVGNSTIDNYVTESFDLNERVHAQKRLLADLNDAIVSAKNAGNGQIGAEVADELLGRANNIQREMTDINTQIARLTGQAGAMTTEAKNMPRLKAVKAVRAVNAANDVNKNTAAESKNLTTGLAEAIKSINDARG